MTGDIRIARGEVDALPDLPGFLKTKSKKFRTAYIVLKELLETERLNQLFRDFHEMVGVPVAILDLAANVLASSKWQRLCTDFHRVNSETCARCIESDTELANHLQAGSEFTLYRCKNGLTDCASPIVIEGEHVANLFTGQFLLEEPDRAFFERQADEFGFPKDAYMAALGEVPVVKEDRVPAIMSFLVHFAQIVASMGLEKLRTVEAEKISRKRLADQVKEKTADLRAVNKSLKTEIAERNILELDLVRQRDFSRHIINSLPGVFYLVSQEGQFLLWNDNLERVSGYDAAEISGLHPTDLFVEKDRELIGERIQALFVEGVADTEASFLTKNGRVLPYFFTGKRIEWEGRPTLIGVGTDISDRLSAEAAIRQSNADLERFAYVVSHDLREPLRMVTGYLQLLERRYTGALDDEAREFIGFAVDGAKRMDALIKDLLKYSRVQTHGGEFSAVDPRAILDVSLDNLQIAMAESDGRVTGGGFPTVMADPDQLLQLFQNLIENALKYRAPDRAPEVEVTASQAGPMATFRVRDNGIGIAPEYAERIFEVFQRLHAREEYSGTGIGLSVCKRIVERHGGKIWMESNPDRGCTFCFTLPVIPRGVSITG